LPDSAKTSPAKPGAEQSAGKKPRKNKTRELVECLLVAGVLAIGIRTFGFQLFKIPTRSMEPELIGNENYGDRVVAAMWYNRGGSILPLKLAKPDRWQVIVFDHYVMEAQDNDDPREVRTNFIKRLIGLPGERVEIRDGDVWINGRIERKPPDVQQHLWTKLCDQDPAKLAHLRYWWRFDESLALDNGAAVLRAPGPGKPATVRWAGFNPEKVDEGRAIDNRFIRPTVKQVTCPDKHAFAAAFDTARPLTFCPVCDKPVWGVRNDDEEGFLRCDNLRRKPDTDYWTEGKSPSFVPDLRLAADFEYLGGSGELKVVLVGRGDSYRLTLPLGEPGGAARLSSSRPGITAEGRLPVESGKPHHLEVVNVDGAFWAELDGMKLGPCQYEVNVVHGPADASLTLSGAAGLKLNRLQLWRDIYYTWQAPGGNGSLEIEARRGYTRWHPGFSAFHASADDKSFALAGPLGPDEYFFMGDNTLASQDSRAFGPKKEGDIVARAIFVAWPPSRFHLVW